MQLQKKHVHEECMWSGLSPSSLRFKVWKISQFLSLSLSLSLSLLSLSHFSFFSLTLSSLSYSLSHFILIFIFIHVHFHSRSLLSLSLSLSLFLSLSLSCISEQWPWAFQPPPLLSQPSPHVPSGWTKWPTISRFMRIEQFVVAKNVWYFKSTWIFAYKNGQSPYVESWRKPSWQGLGMVCPRIEQTENDINMHIWIEHGQDGKHVSMRCYWKLFSPFQRILLNLHHVWK